MQIAVTGIHGQVVSALHERAASQGVNIIAIGRPILDLSKSGMALQALASVQADVIVNAAGYTAVDQAEQEAALASRINTFGAGEVATAARTLNLPLIHLSTDYVFNGKKHSPYVENDPVSPLNVYGLTKAAGEKAVADLAPNHAIIRTSWIYSPFGRNFVRTILHLAKTRNRLDVVADQVGAPTSAFDVADGVIAVAKNLVLNPDNDSLRGLFHMTASGDTNWADFAEAVFAVSGAAGGPFATIHAVASKDYPQAARRPTNSRLDCTKIAAVHGVRLPDWRSSLKLCVERIVKTDEGMEDTE